MARGERLKNYNGLTTVEQKFCDEYLKTQDTYKAMLAAGYSKSTARVKGTSFYKRPQVQDYLQRIAKSVERETIATTAEVREFLTRVVRGQEEVEELVNRFDGGGIQVIEREMRKPNNREKLDAAEKLLKVSGAYNKDFNINVKPIVIKDDLS